MWLMEVLDVSIQSSRHDLRYQFSFDISTPINMVSLMNWIWEMGWGINIG